MARFDYFFALISCPNPKQLADGSGAAPRRTLDMVQSGPITISAERLPEKEDLVQKVEHFQDSVCLTGQICRAVHEVVMVFVQESR